MTAKNSKPTAAPKNSKPTAAPKSAPAVKGAPKGKKGKPVAAPAEAAPVAKKAGTPAAAHPRDVTGAGFAFAVPRRQGTGVDALGYTEGSRGNVIGAVLLKLAANAPGMTAKQLTETAGPLTRKGGATEDSIRAALSHMLHRAYVVLDAGCYALTHNARTLLNAGKK